MKERFKRLGVFFIALMIILPLIKVKAVTYDSSIDPVLDLKVYEDGTIVWTRSLYAYGIWVQNDLEEEYHTALKNAVSPNNPIINLIELIESNCPNSSFGCDTSKEGTFKVLIKENSSTEYYTNSEFTVTYQDGKLSGSIVEEKTDNNVSFETYGGLPIPENQIVKSGNQATKPIEEPIKDGAKFAGWYSDSEFKNKFDFSKPITKDTIIYAKYNSFINTIDISYDLSKVPFAKNATREYFIDWIRENTKSNTDDLFVYSNANTELYSMEEGVPVYITENEEELGLEKEYAILYSIRPVNDAKSFIDSVTSLDWTIKEPISEVDGLVVRFNGEERNDVFVGYSESWNCIMIYIPIGKASEKVQVFEPKAKISANNNTLTINWDKQVSAEKYQVYRSLDNKKWTKLSTVEAESYQDKKLTYGKTYYYKVRAYDGSKWTSFSKIVKKKVTPNKVVLKVTGGSTNNIKLSWSKSGASGYVIERSTNNKKWTAIKTQTALTLNNKKLTENKTYYYRVRAFKTVGRKIVYGPYSEVVKVKTAPVKPTVSLTIKDYNNLRIVTKTSKGATNYILDLADNEKFKMAENLNLTNAIDESFSVPMGTTIYARIKACNSYNICSGWNKVSKRLIPSTPKLSLTTTSKKVTVSISKVDEATNYQIYRSTSKNGKYSLVKTLNVEDGALTFVNSTKKGKTYYYKVRSYTTIGDKNVYSSFSKIKSIKSK